MTRSGNAKLVGSESPADVIIAGTPRFGYRCLQTDGNTSYVQGTGSFSLSSSGTYEFSLWVRPTASNTGNILQLFNGSAVIFSAALNPSLNVVCSSVSAWGVNLTSSQTLQLNTWTLLRFQFSPAKFSLKIGSAEAASGTLAALSFNVTSLRIGGLTGQIDEFIFRDSLTDSIPTQPVQGRLDIAEIGGYGSGALGNVTITANCVMSSAAYLSARMPGGYTTFVFTGHTAGKFGTFKAGDEVMLLTPQTGEYEFNSVVNVMSSQITLASTPKIPISYGSTMIVQVPHFNSLTVNSGVTVSPPQRTSSVAGGIIAFRVKGNCTINGRIITHGYGLPRTDTLQMTHSKLIDNFLCGSGGGIFIACGGTFTAGANARLGASWSGAGKGGVPVSRSKGGDGGAGYGGAGGSDTDNDGLGGSGGVGGGGGGGNGNHASAAGVGGDTGGHGANGSGIVDDTGGTQGKTLGGNSPNSRVSSGGGGAGGNSGSTSAAPLQGSYSGANIILIAKTLKVDEAALSTGGQGGQSNKDASGGGGTGFCYIACEVMN